MLYPIKFSPKTIEKIISKLKELYPDLNIRLNHADPRFLLVSRLIGTQRVDTIPISITETVEIHLSEAVTLLEM